MTARTCAIDDCARRHYAKGWCYLHWGRHRRNGTTDTILPTAEERFWAKVDKTETCWLWTGRLSTVGYAVFQGDGLAYGHRWAYHTYVGPIPEGMHVDHKCHVRHCVNPDHLQVVTPGQNNENRRGAQRDSTTGIRGVSFHRGTGKYRINARGKYGGLFRSIEDAEKAVIALRNELMTNNLADSHAHADVTP